MNNSPLGWVALAVSVGNFLALIFLAATRISRVESRVEILWAFLMRRGIVEAMDSGLIKHNSPLTVPSDVRQMYNDLLDKVTKFYRATGHRLSDMDLVLAVENRFWHDIVKMSLTSHVHEGACVAVILNVLRPEADIFKEFEPILWETDKTEDK